MVASLNDLWTTAQNLVTAVNGVTTAIQRSLGTATSTTVSADTLVITGLGRLVSFSVVDGGSADGTIYNANAIASAADANALVVVPQTSGTYPVGAVFNSGLVIKPGTSQKINVTYYLG